MGGQGSVSLLTGNQLNGMIPVTGNSSNNGGSTLNFNSKTQGLMVSINDANGGTVSAAHMEVCFNDLSGSGKIYQWYDANMWSTWFKSTTTAPRWVPVPTTNGGGMACGQSWLPGEFVLVP